MTRTYCGIAVGFLLTLPGASVAAEPTRFEYSQPHMGTQFRIVLYAPDEARAKKVADAAFARIARLDDTMSDYRETSELMVLCRQAGGPPIKISDDLFYVLSKAQELARRTDGAFDVTVGPVVRLWRRARRQRELPDPKRLAEALELVGHEKLRLDDKAQTAQLLKKGMLLDLGGIAKGYAADEAMQVLKQHGIRSALVAAGGDIVVSDPPPGSTGWTIGIAPLGSADQPPTQLLLLRNAAVSTAGDAEQYVEIKGKRYSHILDPKTGVGLIGRRSVTVVAPNGTLSDSLDTAVSVLGPERGLQLIDATEGTAALILQATETGIRTFESKQWKDVPKK
jgi:thiamine biosynthesis lipoprotein